MSAGHVKGFGGCPWVRAFRLSWVGRRTSLTCSDVFPRLSRSRALAQRDAVRCNLLVLLDILTDAYSQCEPQPDTPLVQKVINPKRSVS